ncbi:related to pol protein [Ustilago sp. UG-2017b]|nr:related to pol protein [Ustilago sp. UG-2017b]
MMDPDISNKLDRLLALLEAQLELTRQGQREERLRRAHLTEEAMDLSHLEYQAGGGDESMIGDPHTPTPAPRPRRSVSFADMDEQEDVNYEKYASPTRPRYVKSRVDPYNKSRTEHYVLDQEEDSSIMAELNRSKPITTPFPKFNLRDVEIFILEAETWFKFNQVYEQSRMINHMGAQLEGNAREWRTSKLRIDRAREGRLFNDWHYFTERLTEQFNPRNARMEAYNKLLALRLTSDAPGVATHHVERFRDLEGQVNLDDNELVIDLFRGSLTRSLQEKFERNPPNKRWEWYREVEEIDRQRMLLQQASARHSQTSDTSFSGNRPIQSSIPVRRSAAQSYSTRSPAQPYQPSQPYPARHSTQNLPHSNNRPLPHQPTPAPKGTPAPSGGSNNTCHVCKGIGHWARDCPSRRVDSLGSRPMGPKVMVVTKDPFEETTDPGDGHSGNTEPEQEDMNLSPYQQHMDSDHEDEQDDDDDEGNDCQVCFATSGGKAVLELSGTVQDHPARILANTGAGLSIVSDSFIRFTELRRLKPTIRWDTGQLEFKTQEQDRPPRRPPEAAGAKALSMKSPTLHGNEFVSAERILQAALEDGPIGFMLLEESPSSLPAFGFVPTGADKGVEMEVEVDKEVTAADIPKPYQHLRDVFDEVEADKLPHHTEHDLHLELVEGSVMGRNAQEARGSLVHMEGAQTHMRRRTGSISEESQAQPRRGPSSRSGHSHKEDQAQGACRQLPFRGSRDKSQRNRHRSKEEEQCIGDRQASPEEEEQCRRRRHSSGGQEWR